MKRDVVGARELKTRLGSYLQRVRQGQSLVVTDRGEPVAELRPLTSDSALPVAVLALAAKGGVTLPVREAISAFRAIRSRGGSLSGAVTEDREDRF